MHSKIIVYVPSSIVKYILNQLDSEGKWGRWIAKIKEYGLEIKPTKLIKGQGLAKLLIESNYETLGINSLDIAVEEGSGKLEVNENILTFDWYRDIVYIYKTYNAHLIMINRRPSL